MGVGFAVVVGCEVATVSPSATAASTVEGATYSDLRTTSLARTTLYCVMAVAARDSFTTLKLVDAVDRAVKCTLNCDMYDVSRPRALAGHAAAAEWGLMVCGRVLWEGVCPEEGPGGDLRQVGC